MELRAVFFKTELRAVLLVLVADRRRRDDTDGMESGGMLRALIGNGSCSMGIETALVPQILVIPRCPSPISLVVVFGLRETTRS
jgi:hypothetical protein